MKKMTFLLLIIFFASCAVVKTKVNKYEIVYDDNLKDYVTYFYGDFKDCKKIRAEVVKDAKKSFETELMGGVEDIALSIPLAKLDFGQNILRLYCDEKKDGLELPLWHFKSAVLRFPYTDAFNDDLITPETEELMETELFLNELKTYILTSEDNFKKMYRIYPFINSKDRIAILSEVAKKYKSNEIDRIIVENLAELIFDNDSLKLFDVLFAKKDSNLDLELFNVLMTRPEIRIYNKYFNFFLSRPHLKQALIEKLIQDKESPFFFEAVKYFKTRFLEEGLKDPYVATFVNNYFLYNEKELDFIIDLLAHEKRYKDGLYILDNFDISFDTTRRLFKNFSRFNKEVRLFVFQKTLPVFQSDQVIIDEILKYRDESFVDYQLEFLNRFDSRYEDRYFQFVKELIERNVVLPETVNYLLGAPNHIKKYGFRKLFEIKGDFYFVSLLKYVDPEFYESTALENVKNKGRFYYESLGILGEFKDKYLDLLIKAYEDEKNNVYKNNILLTILNAHPKGYQFAYEQVFKKPYDRRFIGIYSELAKKAEKKYLEDIINSLAEFEKDIFVDVTIGLEAGKNRFDCRNVLGSLFNKKTDMDEIVRINWTWAYSCPDSFTEFLTLSEKYIKDEKLMIEVIDAINDVIFELNVDIRKTGIEFAKKIYQEMPNGSIRLRVGELLSKIGFKEDLEFLEKLIKDADDDYSKELLDSYLLSFKERYNIVDAN